MFIHHIFLGCVANRYYVSMQNIYISSPPPRANEFAVKFLSTSKTSWTISFSTYNTYHCYIFYVNKSPQHNLLFFILSKDPRIGLNKYFEKCSSFLPPAVRNMICLLSRSFRDSLVDGSWRYNRKSKVRKYCVAVNIVQLYSTPDKKSANSKK